MLIPWRSRDLLGLYATAHALSMTDERAARVQERAPDAEDARSVQAYRALVSRGRVADSVTCRRFGARAGSGTWLQAQSPGARPSALAGRGCQEAAGVGEAQIQGLARAKNL